MKRSISRFAGWGALVLATGCSITFPVGSPPTPPDVAPDAGDFFPSQPWTEPLVVQDHAPPPLSGGTLTILHDGNTAVAADPDRDRVFIVDLAAATLTATVALTAGDEPGRVIEDHAGRAHVVLRSGNAVATIDPTSGKLLGRRAVCAAPRGIAYQAAGDVLQVACATGELWTLSADPAGSVTRKMRLDRDLRDVVVDGDTLVVTRFKTAELLRLDANGQILERVVPPSSGSFTPETAWRAIALPASIGPGVAVLHQRATSEVLSTKQPGGYGGGFGGFGGFVPDFGFADPADGGTDDGGGVVTPDVPESGGPVVRGTVTLVRRGTPPAHSTAINSAIVPIDVAFSADGQSILVIAAGNRANQQQLLMVNLTDLATQLPFGLVGGPSGSQQPAGDATAVAIDGSARVIVQTREPATLQIMGGSTVVLDSESRYDTGHALFHTATQSQLACASCHPEGGEDGHVWAFDFGRRRSQSLRGGVLANMPFHWTGDLADMPTLTATVLQQRMSGPSLNSAQNDALGHFINAIPLLPTPPAADAAAVAAGKLLFNDASVGCATCHGGPRLTTLQLVDVNTQDADSLATTFKVPSLLGVDYRAPFLHSGCAPTLQDRFGACGGGNSHGNTQQLSASQITQLVSYLESL